MATTTLTVNPQIITVSGTDAHDINFDNMLGDNTYGVAMVTVVSGTAVRFNNKAAVDDTNSAPYTANDKEVIEIVKGKKLHYKGGAGSETFKINIVAS
jgi:hypothetical protein